MSLRSKFPIFKVFVALLMVATALPSYAQKISTAEAEKIAQEAYIYVSGA